HVVRMRTDHQQVDAVQVDGFKNLAREKQRHTLKARGLQRGVDRLLAGEVRIDQTDFHGSVS
ncbi:hypothetical protein NLR10_24925, partial [Escherichia coli]|nr:hypothetical protein [Escherichia coli]